MTIGGEAAKDRATRTEILRAATIRFARDGYSATSLASIAQDLDLPEPRVRHHFPTKLTLLQTLLEIRDEPFVAALSQPFLRVEDLVNGIADAVDRSLREPDLVRFQATTVGEAIAEAHPLHDAYRLRERKIIDSLAGLIDTCRDWPKDADAHALAIQLVAVLRGLRAQWTILGDELDLAGSFRAAALRLAVQAISPAENSVAPVTGNLDAR